MGVLDDAIREHIELKRSHGASEAELRREEQEALGPARREAAAPPEGDATRVVEDAPAADAAPTAEASPLDEAPSAEPVDPGSFREEAVDAESFAEVTVEEEGAFARDTVVEEDEDIPEEARTSDDEGEDVLEETPEFLQETPEHDRLWFEQKPPRDFDFDE